jgi:hypothetical protein
MTLELIPLCTGERFQAKKKKNVVAADWLVITPDGIGQIDIRYTVA